MPDTPPRGVPSVVPRDQGRRASRQARRRRRRRRLTITVAAFLALCLLVVAGSFGYAWYLDSEISHTTVHGLRSNGGDTENILLIGSQSRCALDGTQTAAFGSCSNLQGSLSDVMMIIHLNLDTHAASLLSIPRDLFLSLPDTGPGSTPGTSTVDKVDAALNDGSDGPSHLVAAIQDDLGIPIDHYVELNFDSFQGVVAALGGIKMDFPMPLYDQESGLLVTHAGCQSLTPFQALAVVRARHLQYDPDGEPLSDKADWPQDPESDLSRIRRDHEFLRVLASAVARRGLSNPLTDRSLASSLVHYLTLDQTMGASQLADLVLDFHGVDIGSVPTLTLPVIVDAQPYMYDGYSYGDVSLPAQPQDQEVTDQFLGVKMGQDSSGRDLPAPAKVSVTVENGSGVTDQAADTTSALQSLGFDAVVGADQPSTGPVSETTIEYTPGNQAAALQVERALTGTVAIVPGPPNATTPVTVVTGSNFVVVPSLPAVAGSTSPSSSTSSSSSTTSSNGTSASTSTTGTSASGGISSPIADNPELDPPSPSVEALAPFDPRACTAAQLDQG